MNQREPQRLADIIRAFETNQLFALFRGCCLRREVMPNAAALLQCSCCFTQAFKYAGQGIGDVSHHIAIEQGDSPAGARPRQNAACGDEGIHKRWQDIMPQVYRKIFNREDVTDFIAMHEPTLSACPFPLRTSFDWIWWFNFTNKWQHVKYRMLAHKPWRNPKESFKKIKHFYDTPTWQRWSFDNHDKKIGAEYHTYKLAAKVYIVESTGFTDYITKPKVGSLFQIWRSSDFHEAIDTDFNYLTRKEAEEFIR